MNHTIDSNSKNIGNVKKNDDNFLNVLPYCFNRFTCRVREMCCEPKDQVYVDKIICAMNYIKRVMCFESKDHIHIEKVVLY